MENVATSLMRDETITVPDLPAAELIALVERSFQEARIPLDYVNPELATWDFLLNERSKTFQVFMRTFDRQWTAEDARMWQQSLGADGNVAAYLTWVMTKKPTGISVSIPNDDARLYNLLNRSKSTPCVLGFEHVSGDRILGFDSFECRWSSRSYLVAFRII